MLFRSFSKDDAYEPLNYFLKEIGTSLPFVRGGADLEYTGQMSAQRGKPNFENSSYHAPQV